jgi:hypothetical protein
MDVIVHGGSGPVIRAGIDKNNGDRFIKGQEISSSWIVMQDGGGINQNLFEDYAQIWGLGEEDRAPTYAPADVVSAEILPVPYIVTLKTQDQGCLATFPSPENLPNRIIPLMVKGMMENCSAGSLSWVDGQAVWYPGGMLDGDLYLAIERADRYFLGQPVVCDQPDVRVEVLGIDDNQIRISLHNPTSKNLSSSLKVNALLGETPALSQDLKPGEVKVMKLTLRLDALK